MDEDRKVLGVDFGERHIGLAVSINGLVAPFLIVEVKDQISAIEKIVKICQREKIEEIVCGLPLDSEGKIGPAAKKAEEFGQKLGQETGLKIIFWDETLTSEEALAKMIEAGWRQKRRRKLDDISAAIILQEYLDSGSSFAKASED